MNSVTPWMEKHRPQRLDDIIMDEEIMNMIKILVNTYNVHIIFTGDPGLGKTSTVKCIAKFSLEEDINEGYLELNAAEDRSMKKGDTRIPCFCKKKVAFEKSKIILLDEADNLTKKYQNEIAELIKIYGDKTKFVFTCNDAKKISSDIQSLCRIIRFRKLSSEQIKKCLMKICAIEKVKYDHEGLDLICNMSEGDMRKSINNLQKTFFTFNSVTKKNVLRVCQIPDPEKIQNILQLCLIKKLCDADNLLCNLIDEGYCYSDLLSAFTFIITNYSELSDEDKIKLLEIVNQTRIIVSSGIKSRLQMSSMLCNIILQVS
jgi:replication factor C subunit 2/4